MRIDLCRCFITLFLRKGGAVWIAVERPATRSYEVYCPTLKSGTGFFLFTVVIRGFPGARCVLAAGFRLRRKNHGRDQLLTGYGQHLIDLAQTGTISIEEGIKSAITVKPFVAAMPEAQANFAFTKAYLVDASGSRAGFSGNRLFVDTSLFSRLPDWLSIG